MALMLIASAQIFAKRYAGGDISLLPEYENAGAVYFDQDGKKIASLLPYLHEEGLNAMRVRLFVNPEDYKGADRDPNACQDLDYILPLCRRIVDQGFDLMLDFHYSDTWADPAKQWTPEAWKDLSDNQLCEKIYSYTRQTLLTLKEAGVTPRFIQTGNEISYGMLWGPVGAPASSLKKTFMGSDANWDRLGRLLREAGKACREVCPEAKIVLHTERVAQPDVLVNFYDRMQKLGVDYEIIGLSYYPYFHGDIPVLDKALSTLQSRYPSKEIMIVETGYSYKWEVPGSTHDLTAKYPYSEAGQDKFLKDLIATLDKYNNVDGLFWWWLEYNAYDTKLSGWYNAPLFDSTNGRATPALRTLCGFAKGEGAAPAIIPDEGEDALTRWYRLDGTPTAAPTLPGIYLLRHGSTTRKIMVR